jgi:hypothetical protein
MILAQKNWMNIQCYVPASSRVTLLARAMVNILLSKMRTGHNSQPTSGVSNGCHEPTDVILISEYSHVTHMFLHVHTKILKTEVIDLLPSPAMFSLERHKFSPLDSKIWNYPKVVSKLARTRVSASLITRTVILLLTNSTKCFRNPPIL